ncbi:hypothetical protein [Spirosoma validum]|uniref:Uncharacterized protein n=1 Tax=Spirosoma validum TaxID=2771355 RepID=A0A927B0L4_9BACT|nr:hypothetical protein [Spirosoma validum]MBD2753072.1 hypothetical protein [Spirosoma validum]
MNFFVPFTTDPEQAQLVCQWVETRLQQMGFSVFREPVFQVTSLHGSQPITNTVGQKSVCTGEVVMIILRNDLECLICSYSKGFMRGEPIRIPVSQVEAVLVFG